MTSTILFILMMLFSCKSDDEIKIFHIANADFIDTVKSSNKPLYNKISYFIINGNISNKSKLSNVVDSFAVHTSREQMNAEFNEYSMMFYKESPETNLGNIRKDPKKLDDVYAQQHDLILVYSWANNRNPIKYEYKNGEIINPKGKLIITDVK